MGTSARKHAVPLAGETPTRAAITSGYASVNDIVPVANTTARAQLLVDLANPTDGSPAYAPSASRPLYVSRADLTGGSPLEVTTDGSTWYRVGRHAAMADATLPGGGAEIASGVVTTLGWGTTTLAGGVTTAGGAFTVPVAGRYLVTYGVAWPANAAGGRSTFVGIGGVSVRALQADQAGSANSGVTTAASRALTLAAGQSLQLVLYQNSGGPLVVTQAGTWLTIDWIG